MRANLSLLKQPFVFPETTSTASFSTTIKVLEDYLLFLRKMNKYADSPAELQEFLGDLKKANLGGKDIFEFQEYVNTIKRNK